VMMDIVARRAESIRAREGATRARPPRGRRRRGASQRFDDRAQRTPDVELARHVALAEPQVGIHGQADERLSIVDQQVPDRRLRTAVGGTLVPEFEANAGGGDRVLNACRQPSIEARRPSANDVRIGSANGGCNQRRMSVSAHGSRLLMRGVRLS
jgi:hypothetical protein